MPVERTDIMEEVESELGRSDLKFTKKQDQVRPVSWMEGTFFFFVVFILTVDQRPISFFTRNHNEDNDVINKTFLASHHLLLSLGDLISLFSFLGLLGTDAPQLSVGPGLGNGVVSLEVLQLLCQLHGSGSLSIGLQWQKLAAQLGGLLNVLLRSISLPGLLGLEGEEDQLSLVFFQTLGVELE